MPTGYTAGILDGDITTFQQFAKTCMRAFGATVHMREDDFDAEWTPREVNPYHTKNILLAKERLADAIIATDSELISIEEDAIDTEFKRMADAINQKKEDKDKLLYILTKAREFEAPTKEHQPLKQFMIKQINDTIDFDCGTEYYKDQQVKLQERLDNLDVKKIREEKIADAKRDIKYNQEALEKNVKLCKEHNQWVIDLLDAIK